MARTGKKSPTPRTKGRSADGSEVFETAAALEAATRKVCANRVRSAFDLTWEPRTESVLRAALADDAPGLMEELAGVIRRIRALVAQGKWTYPGDEIVVRVRAPGPPDAGAVGPGFFGPFGPADPRDAMQRLFARTFGALSAEPLRVLVDDDPAAGSHVVRVRTDPRARPRTDVLRQQLAVHLGDAHTHKNIAALSILFQRTAFFTEAFDNGCTRPVDVLEQERRAIQAACKDVGIRRKRTGRPRGE